MRTAFPRSLISCAIAASIGVASPAAAQNTGPVQPFAGVEPAPFYHAPNVDRNINRAQVALNEHRYADAKRLLDEVAGSPWNAKVSLMAGIASLGVNDLRTARTQLAWAVKQEPGYLDAQTVLALTEIKLGNRDAADRLLDQITQRQARCDGACKDSAKLDQAVSVIRKSLI